jgi:hypothetical protein
MHTQTFSAEIQKGVTVNASGALRYGTSLTARAAGSKSVRHDAFAAAARAQRY